MSFLQHSDVITLATGIETLFLRPPPGQETPGQRPPCTEAPSIPPDWAWDQAATQEGTSYKGPIPPAPPPHSPYGQTPMKRSPCSKLSCGQKEPEVNLTDLVGGAGERPLLPVQDGVQLVQVQRRHNATATAASLLGLLGTPTKSIT